MLPVVSCHVVAPSLVLALSLLTAAGAPATTGEPWLAEPFSVDAATLLAAAEAVPAPADADVHLLLSDHLYRFDEEGRLLRRWRLVYRVLTSRGARSWDGISAPWDPWHEERPELRARVLTADGREHWLDPESLSEEPAAESGPNLYSDRRVLSAPLPAVAVGAVVEESGEIRDVEPFFAAGGVWRHPLGSSQPTLHHRLVLDAPTALPLRFGTRLVGDLEPERTVADGRVRLLFERREVPALDEVEPGLPPEAPRWPQVAFSTAAGWQDVARAYSQIVDRQIADADLGPWTEPPLTAPSVAERAQAYLARIHRDVRYTGLELGESSIVPATPAQVHERRYGDCKDQASLLVALLRADGIPAYVALLRAADPRDVESQLPGLGRFDHAIVFVPGADPIWIDPTDPHTPAGELPEPAQDRWALVAAPTTGELLRTPGSISIANRDLETREVFLADHGPSRIVETTEYHGTIASGRRAYHEWTTRDDREERYREYVVEVYRAGELGRVEEIGSDDPTRPYHLELEALDAEVAVTDLSNAIVVMPLGGLSRLPAALTEPPDDEDDEPREHPFYFSEPFVSERRYVIHPPAGLVLRELPEEVTEDVGTGRYAQRFTQHEDGTVEAVLRFDSGPRRADAGSVADYRRAASELLEADPVLVWFDDPGRMALDEGRAIDAVEHYRALVAREPEKGIHRIRFSQVLLELGMGREARAQAERAVSLSPELPEAHWALGWALEHDELGRLRVGDWDRAGALAAFDRGLAVAPPGHVILLEKAILLEHDERGRRYLDATALGEAAELYGRYLDESEDEEADYVHSRMVALYHAGRHEDVLEVGADVDRLQVASRGLRLATRVIVDGEAALRGELETLASDPGTQTELLAAAGNLLWQTRHYPEAAELLGQAARRLDDPSQVLGLVRVIEKTRRSEELELDPTRPDDVVRTLFTALGDPESGNEAFLAVTHPAVRAHAADEVTAGLASFDELTAVLPGVDSRALVDLVIAGFDLKLQGDLERGHRVHLTSAIYDTELILYLSEHDGRPFLVATSDDGPTVAGEVRRRLAAGDVEGARQWLDWVRRDNHEASSADDPFLLSPFHRVWPQESGDVGAERMALAADVLTTLGWANAQPSDRPWAHDEVAAALPRLATAADTAEPDLRRALAVAHLDALDLLERREEAIDLIRELRADAPPSLMLELRLASLLVAEERWQELEALATASLDGDPAMARMARHMLGTAAASRGDIAAADAIYREIEERGDTIDATFNDWAWALLFAEGEEQRALELAEKAAQRTGHASRSTLHTLATAYAWANRPLDARRVMLPALDLADGYAEAGTVGDVDWLVWGRIAESFGFTEVAAEYYARVEPPESEALSSYRLAQKRLGALERPRESSR